VAFDLSPAAIAGGGHLLPELDQTWRANSGSGWEPPPVKIVLPVLIKEVYLTSGDNDLLIIVDTPSGDNVAKFALALGSQGNVRTRTARAWPQSEFQKLISELP
jgi:GYD domain